MTATTSKLGADVDDKMLEKLYWTAMNNAADILMFMDEARAILARQPAAIDRQAVYVPVEPTEEMIRAACLNQSKAQFSSYEEWLDSHSSGVSERIRDLVTGDYRAMLAASPAAPSVEQDGDLQSYRINLSDGTDTPDECGGY